jgi:superfamily I DNA and/or RNA helicase
MFPYVPHRDLKKWVGTVHTMQGKEANAVIIVLGGNPERLKARTFAIGSPNLLNVAVTWARRRLYVIGNRRTWGTAPYFEDLADRMDTWSADEHAGRSFR